VTDESAKRRKNETVMNEFMAVLQPHIVQASTQPTVIEEPEAESSEFVRAPHRPLLYHYTTLDGMLGITESASIYASDARYMNDASEMTYASQAISSVVAAVLSEVESEPLKAALPDRPGFANAFEYGQRPFIACFCEQGDLLSQWRGYGGGEPAFSLGLDLSSLVTLGRLGLNTFLRKVIYDKTEQERTVRAITQDWVAAASEMILRGKEVGDVFPYPAIWALQRALAEQHLSFKHPSFAEEREWRIIKLVDVREEMSLKSHLRSQAQMRALSEEMEKLGHARRPHASEWNPYANAEGVDIRFRRSPAGLVPYVEIPLREFAGVFSGQLPLWRVVQGPTENPELAFEAAALYLESKDYGFHTDFRPSRIPLRW
jgi:hypothetical protein